MMMNDDKYGGGIRTRPVFVETTVSGDSHVVYSTSSEIHDMHTTGCALQTEFFSPKYRQLGSQGLISKEHDCCKPG